MSEPRSIGRDSSSCGACGASRLRPSRGCRSRSGPSKSSRTAACRPSGSLSTCAGCAQLRPGVLERFYGKGVMALFRDVKRAYDPLCILNPGVIIPTTDWSPLAALKVGDETAIIPEDIATRLREVERSAAWATPKLELAQ